MALTHQEREAMLAEPHVAALSVDAGPGRGPLTVPLWYLYTADGDLQILTGADSRKARLIKAAGRFSLMIDRVDPTARYISVEGPVIDISPGTRAHLHAMASRYLPAELVDAYVDFADANHGETVLITLRPEHHLSADLGDGSVAN
ncbi:pyridoxamine 5'-phosphate oxidase family protein [Yinghuangia soli]|uniref:Pyridoxamine 5'-phosphate oxidase family protein n=1 Tax=Yinghuangia soli TaxID=2908204 RepID=A0AA41PVB6_9ACTN|nr:pyridoxamine 5'-phosphate oxidase family protein [Yinghuangia soli]MCF2526025.1 pyridoxamine 5'-phosphate oxidase family protein [Yinghuangia soli]